MSIPAGRLYGRRYPWDRWFLAATSDSIRLVQGLDFNGRVDTFVAQLRRAAVSRRLGLEVTRDPDGRVVRVRVVRLLGETRKRGRRPAVVPGT